MDGNELKNQRIRNRAELNKLQRRYDSGDKSVQPQIAELKGILAGIVAYGLDRAAVTPERIITPASVAANKKLVARITNEDQFTPEQQAMLQNLRDELTALDKEKSRKINALAKLDRSQNHRTEVQEIKNLREKWRSKSDEVYYFIAHGETYKRSESRAVSTEPVDEADFESSEYWKTLPRDPAALVRIQLNTRSNLSKYKTRLKTAKTIVKQADYKLKISKAEIELRMIDNLLGML